MAHFTPFFSFVDEPCHFLQGLLSLLSCVSFGGKNVWPGLGGRVYLVLNSGIVTLSSCVVDSMCLEFSITVTVNTP